ncbi:MAG: site-specific integrase [Methylocystaceae bacterium]|nr:site-specific integrase [Methylocystaceae bacterium]
MTLKHAKTLTNNQVKTVLRHIADTRYPSRNTVIFLLSVKAGLRAGEIAALTWPMVLNSNHQVGETIELHNSAAKKGSGRVLPLHPLLKKALINHWKENPHFGHVVTSERGEAMSANSIVNWFGKLYRELSMLGCSSHSGRRTFITNAARSVHKVGGSLRDVQLLAGHSSIGITQRYIEGDTQTQRRLVALI